MYLLIENKGEAPIESFTLLGMSTARGNGLIGKFGSGTKHSINLLLRKGIEFHIYSGRTRLEFFYKPDVIDDGLSKTEVQRVYCRKGTRTLDLGWVLDFGAMDWKEPFMACREFVSNAIDRTLREGNDLSTVRVEAEPNRRARSGYTRVYIRMNEQINEFYLNRSKYFLHLVDPEKAKTTFLSKHDDSPPAVYREGVFVREGRGKASIFDYNFADSDIEIDECRNASEYTVRQSMARAINAAPVDVLVKLFDALSKEEFFEGELDDYFLSWDQINRKAWKQAWETVAGDAIAASSDQRLLVEFAERKGYKVKVLQSKSFVDAAQAMGVPTVSSTLSKSEAAGKQPVPPTQAARDAVSTVWEWLKGANLTGGRPFPEVSCFRSIMDAGCETYGYWENNTVFLREDIASECNKYLLKVALEEVAHHVTRATDNSRDFQNFVIDLAVELAA